MVAVQVANFEDRTMEIFIGSELPSASHMCKQVSPLST